MHKRGIVLSIIMLTASLAIAQVTEQTDLEVDSVGFLEMATGKIAKIGDTWLIITEIRDSERHYVPTLLPEEFRIEGLEVAFSAVVGKNPPHVRAMGEPVALRDIRKLVYADPDQD